MRRGLPQGISIFGLAMGAGLSSMGSFLTFLAIGPERMLPAVSTYGFPLFALNFAATGAAALAILHAGLLRNERHLLRSAIRHAPDFFYVKDCKSQFVAVNETTAKFHGLETPEGLRGKSDIDLIGGEHGLELYKREQDLIRTGQALANVEEKLPDRHGNERFYVTTKVPLSTRRGTLPDLLASPVMSPMSGVAMPN
jgi:PAS domain S-box-containing protein